MKISHLKRKLWTLVSQYVRMKESKDGYCQCVTCGKSYYWKEIQAGHFIPRAQGMATYFDLRNIHPQCFRCNINLGGYGAKYSEYMRNRYGQDVIDELLKLSGTTLKLTRDWYQEQIAHYKAEIKSLE